MVRLQLVQHCLACSLRESAGEIQSARTCMGSTLVPAGGNSSYCHCITNSLLPKSGRQQACTFMDSTLATAHQTKSARTCIDSPQQQSVIQNGAATFAGSLPVRCKIQVCSW